MAVRSVKVTTRDVDGLICPFTGKPVDVYMHVQPGSITYSAPEAFSLQVPVEGLETLVERATMRNGVIGSVRVRGLPVDPYTGESLSLRDFGDGRFCYTGGFNPRAARESLPELLHFLRMRNGVSDLPLPGKVPEVVSVRRTHYAKSHDVSIGSDTLKAAESAVDRAGVRKPSVSFSRRGAQRQ